jgi:hypothetical protein
MWTLSVKWRIFLLFSMGAGFISLVSQDTDLDGWLLILLRLLEILRAFAG